MLEENPAPRRVFLAWQRSASPPVLRHHGRQFHRDLSVCVHRLSPQPKVVIQSDGQIFDYLAMGNLARARKIFGFVAALLFVIGPSETPRAQDDDPAAFKSAYAADQKFEEAGDYGQAAREANAAYGLARKLFGDQHANTAALAHNCGLLLIESNDSVNARSGCHIAASNGSRNELRRLIGTDSESQSRFSLLLASQK
ncbi:MAG: tetratricopeptide repeat protein [Gammaproteobacteria bacterium]|nr:tetratricopeptide repeat protein [Gammaproteobacteria bacterium]